MKIVVYGPKQRTGVLRDDGVVDVSGAVAKYLGEQKGERDAVVLAGARAPADLAAFINAGDAALELTEAAVTYLLSDAADQTGVRGEALVHALGDVALHAPRPADARTACAGGNFADHAELMAARSGHPFEGGARDHMRKTGIWGFWKLHREFVPSGGEMIYPKRATYLDYEGELAIVLGKGGKNIRPEDVADYVWGVTLLGDWSIRREPEAGAFKFAMQKNFDTSCSLGPCIAVGEVDPFTADVETLVNGEVRQSFNCRDMVFSFGEYLEYLSQDFTLYPGDIISGGTAAGTAADSAPLNDDGTPSLETFLKPGDDVEVRSPGIGSLTAHVVESR